jgi:hypothetical protein
MSDTPSPSAASPDPAAEYLRWLDERALSRRKLRAEQAQREQADARMCAALDRLFSELAAEAADEPDPRDQSFDELQRDDEATFAYVRRSPYRETHNNIRRRPMKARRRAGMPARRRSSCSGRPGGRRVRRAGASSGSGGGDPPQAGDSDDGDHHLGAASHRTSCARSRGGT